jgi:hypothetical protein
MSFLKLNGGACVMLAALAMLLASYQIAMADTTTLVCHDSTPNPTTLDLDEAKGLVTIHRSDWPGHPGPTEVFPQAKFTQNEITFERDILSEHQTYRINRLTGDFVAVETGWHWTCQAGKKQV